MPLQGPAKLLEGPREHWEATGGLKAALGVLQGILEVTGRHSGGARMDGVALVDLQRSKVTWKPTGGLQGELGGIYFTWRTVESPVRPLACAGAVWGTLGSL